MLASTSQNMSLIFLDLFPKFGTPQDASRKKQCWNVFVLGHPHVAKFSHHFWTLSPHADVPPVLDVPQWLHPSDHGGHVRFGMFNPHGSTQPTEMFFISAYFNPLLFFGVRYCLVGQGWWKTTFKDIRTDYWPTIHLALNSSWCSHSVVRCKALLWDSRSSSSGFSRCFVLAFATWTALKIPYIILYS